MTTDYLLRYHRYKQDLLGVRDHPEYRSVHHPEDHSVHHPEDYSRDYPEYHKGRGFS